MVKRRAAPWDHVEDIQVTVHDAATTALEATGSPVAPTHDNEVARRRQGRDAKPIWDMSYEPFVAALRKLELKLSAKSESCGSPSPSCPAIPSTTDPADVVTPVVFGEGAAVVGFRPRNIESCSTKSPPSGSAALGTVEKHPCGWSGVETAKCNASDSKCLFGSGLSHNADGIAVAGKSAFSPAEPDAARVPSVKPVSLGADFLCRLARKPGPSLHYRECIANSGPLENAPEGLVSSSSHSLVDTLAGAAVTALQTATLPPAKRRRAAGGIRESSLKSPVVTRALIDEIGPSDDDEVPASDIDIDHVAVRGAEVGLTGDDFVDGTIAPMTEIEETETLGDGRIAPMPQIQETEPLEALQVHHRVLSSRHVHCKEVHAASQANDGAAAALTTVDESVLVPHAETLLPATEIEDRDDFVMPSFVVDATPAPLTEVPESGVLLSPECPRDTLRTTRGIVCRQDSDCGSIRRSCSALPARGPLPRSGSDSDSDIMQSPGDKAFSHRREARALAYSGTDGTPSAFDSSGRKSTTRSLVERSHDATCNEMGTSRFAPSALAAARKAIADCGSAFRTPTASCGRSLRHSEINALCASPVHTPSAPARCGLVVTPKDGTVAVYKSFSSPTDEKAATASTRDGVASSQGIVLESDARETSETKTAFVTGAKEHEVGASNCVRSGPVSRGGTGALSALSSALVNVGRARSAPAEAVVPSSVKGGQFVDHREHCGVTDTEALATPSRKASLAVTSEDLMKNGALTAAVECDRDLQRSALDAAVTGTRRVSFSERPGFTEACGKNLPAVRVADTFNGNVLTRPPVQSVISAPAKTSPSPGDGHGNQSTFPEFPTLNQSAAPSLAPVESVAKGRLCRNIARPLNFNENCDRAEPGSERVIGVVPMFTTASGKCLPPVAPVAFSALEPKVGSVPSRARDSGSVQLAKECAKKSFAAEVPKPMNSPCPVFETARGKSSASLLRKHPPACDSKSGPFCTAREFDSVDVEGALNVAKDCGQFPVFETASGKSLARVPPIDLLASDSKSRPWCSARENDSAGAVIVLKGSTESNPLPMFKTASGKSLAPVLPIDLHASGSKSTDISYRSTKLKSDKENIDTNASLRAVGVNEAVALPHDFPPAGNVPLFSTGSGKALPFVTPKPLSKVSIRSGATTASRVSNAWSSSVLTSASGKDTSLKRKRVRTLRDDMNEMAGKGSLSRPPLMSSSGSVAIRRTEPTTPAQRPLRRRLVLETPRGSALKIGPLPVGVGPSYRSNGSGMSVRKSKQFKPPKRLVARSLPVSHSSKAVKVIDVGLATRLTSTGSLVSAKDSRASEGRAFPPDTIAEFKPSPNMQWLHLLAFGDENMKACMEKRFPPIPACDRQFFPSDMMAMMAPVAPDDFHLKTFFGVELCIKWVSTVVSASPTAPATTVGSHAWCRMVYSLAVFKHARLALGALQSNQSPESALLFFSASHVMRSFTRRLALEWNEKVVPSLLQIIRKDMSPALHIVLMVLSIAPGTSDCPSPKLILSDGWYVVNARCDDCLSRLLKRNWKRIRVGDKVHICGALFKSCERREFWFGNGDELGNVELELTFNASRVARKGPRRYLKLGRQVGGGIFVTRLGKIDPSGGGVPAAVVILRRTYPMLFVEKTEDGRMIFRNEAAELLASEAHASAVRDKIVGASCDGGSGKEGNGTEVVEMQRDITPVCEMLVSGIDDVRHGGATAIVSVWRPSTDLRDLLSKPGAVLQLRAAKPSLRKHQLSLRADSGNVSLASKEWHAPADATTSALRPLTTVSDVWSKGWNVGDEIDGVFCVVLVGDLKECGRKRFVYLVDSFDGTLRVIGLELSDELAVSVPRPLLGSTETGKRGHRKNRRSSVGLRNARFVGTCESAGVADMEATSRTEIVSMDAIGAGDIASNTGEPAGNGARDSRNKVRHGDKGSGLIRNEAERTAMRDGLTALDREMSSAGALAQLEFVRQAVRAVENGDKTSVHAYFEQTQSQQ